MTDLVEACQHLRRLLAAHDAAAYVLDGAVLPYVQELGTARMALDVSTTAVLALLARLETDPEFVAQRTRRLCKKLDE